MGYTTMAIFELQYNVPTQRDDHCKWVYPSFFPNKEHKFIIKIDKFLGMVWTFFIFGPFSFYALFA
jgi:hypothetical protein